MTKADIISLIRDKIDPQFKFEKRDISQKIITIVIENFFEIIKEYISKGEHIELRGFGSFETKIREPKKAINPRTKEFVKINRHAIPIFRPGKEFKKIVRENFDKLLNNS